MANDKSQDGRGNYGNKKQHEEAGRQGGKETAKKGPEFYAEIGSDGGSKDSSSSSSRSSQSTNPGNFAEDPKRASREGKKGGSK